MTTLAKLLNSLNLEYTHTLSTNVIEVWDPELFTYAKFMYHFTENKYIPVRYVPLKD